MSSNNVGHLIASTIITLQHFTTLHTKGQGAERVILKYVASIAHIRPWVRNLCCAIYPFEGPIKPKSPSSEESI
jgi:hypothetical protein